MKVSREDKTDSPENESKAVMPKNVPTGLKWRVIILITCLVIIQFWVQHHMAVSLWKSLSGSAFVAILFSVLQFVYESYFGSEDERWKASLYRLTHWMIKDSTLIILSLFILILGSSLSSISVATQGLAEGAEVSLSGENQSSSNSEIWRTTLSKSTPSRKLVWSNLFGSSWLLRVDGYHVQPIQTSSWMGTRIVVERDLKLTPSLLLRIPNASFSIMTDIELEIQSMEKSNEGDSKVQIGPLPISKKDIGAIWIGPIHSIKEEKLAQWIWQLKADSMGSSPDDASPTNSSDSLYVMESIVAKAMSRWANPVHIQSKALPIMTGMELHITLKKNKSKDLVAEKRFIVSSEPWQDVLMEAKIE